MRLSPLIWLAVATAAAGSPTAALACACGCGIFDVGAGSFMPNNANSGLEVWYRLAAMNQDRNWEGDRPASDADNHDKRLSTLFQFLGGQYVVNRSWTVMVELPIYDRSLTTTDDGTVFGRPGSTYTAHDFALGDVELMAMYTGFSKDMSTGVGVGVKLQSGDSHGPTGRLGGPEIDRDSLPGTGSTDIMLEGYHVGSLNRAGTLGYFVQAKYQVAVATQRDYRPGNELDAAVGLVYDFGRVGPFSSLGPVLQLENSWRTRDSGAEADPLNSGYERLLVDPGVSARFKRLRLDGDVAIPVYQHVNAAPSAAIEGTAGQLVAGALFRLQASYDF